MVVVVVVGAAGRGVEGGDAVEVEDEVFPVAHRRGVVLVSREPHWEVLAGVLMQVTLLQRVRRHAAVQDRKSVV